MRNKSDYISIIVFAVLLLCCIAFIIYFSIKDTNKTQYVEKTNVEQQLLEERQQIEQICNNVVMIYNQQLINYYSEPTKENKEIVNKTAEAYNNYFEQKKYIWKGNIPSYITQQLEIIE